MKTSPGAKYANKWGSPLGTGPTDLPLKEFSKNSNRSPRYQPKRAEKTEHDERPVHGFRRISLKPPWLAPQSRYQPNSKKGVNHHIITQVLGQKYQNLGENWRTGGAPKWRQKSKKLFFSPFSTHKNLHQAANCSKITLRDRHRSH